MASFTTVFLLMRCSTAMNISGVSTLPCLSPILTSNSSDAASRTNTILLSSRTCPQPSSLPLLVLPSTVASPSSYPSGYWVKSILQVVSFQSSELSINCVLPDDNRRENGESRHSSDDSRIHEKSGVTSGHK